MTVPERVNLTTGTGWGTGPCFGNTGSVPRLGIPSFCLQDGPQGVRSTDFATHFPSGLAAGSTFNKELMYLRGKAIGLEHRKKGVHIVLGPCLGPIGLKAGGGRNWESFGADPYLQGAAGAATVEGIQEEGVVATLRHFIGNEQEHFRQVGEWDGDLEESISSNIGDRAMHEIYMWPFAEAIRAGAGAAMCSYNRVNNTYACENSFLINYLLKEELGFQGFLMSDWGAQHSGVTSALAGLDMSMPGDIFGDWLAGRSFWGYDLTRAVFNRSVPQSRLDDMATRILAPFFAIDSAKLPTENSPPNFSAWTAKTTDQEYPFQPLEKFVKKNWHVDARSEFSQRAALTVAREAIVLLKNTNNTLPLMPTRGIKRILVAGIAAGPDSRGINCQDQKCVNGVLTSGWGSASMNNPFVISPYEALSQKAQLWSMMVDYSANDWDPGHAAGLAAKADACIVVVSAYSGEGYIQVDNNFGDRNNLSLWHNGDELIKRVAQKCAQTIVVVNAVGPVLMEGWIQLKGVSAVIYCPPLGQYVGQALADVIFGDTSPSGRLPFTIARKPRHYVPIIKDLEENMAEPQDDFERDIYLDYRFFDKHNIKPRFEFGFGLSYTKFRVYGLDIKDVDFPTTKLPNPEPYLPVYENFEDDLVEPEEALFPPHFDRVDGFIYPFLFDEDIYDDENEETESKFWSALAKTNNLPRSNPPIAGGGLGGNPALWNILYQVTATVENTGQISGAYVAQLYVELPTTLMVSPVKVLRGFEKVFLAPGEMTIVSFNLRQRDLSVWDVVSQQWILQNGAYRIYIQSSSRKVELGGEIEIES